MEYGATKLVYSDGKPLWLTADGSFIPARCRNDGSLVNETLFLRDPRRGGALRRIGREPSGWREKASPGPRAAFITEYQGIHALVTQVSSAI